MSHEAAPVWQVYIEESNNHANDPEAFKAAFDKRVEAIKKLAVEGKRVCALRYRAQMYWGGIDTPEKFNKHRLEALENYQSGGFFLERIGRYRSVDTPLTLTLLNLRDQWITEYDIKTAPEFMLLDMALTSYFHFLRLNEDTNNIMANIEWDMFALEAPRFETGYTITAPNNNKAVAEDLAYRLKEIMQPMLDQYQRMFIRNLKALRDLRRGHIMLNIGNVNQVNISDQQVNMTNEPRPKQN